MERSKFGFLIASYPYIDSSDKIDSGNKKVNTVVKIITQVFLCGIPYNILLTARVRNMGKLCQRM